MSKSLELPDATYDLILAQAKQEGITPVELIEQKLRPASTPAQPVRTLYDKLKPFIGCVQGTGENLAADHSELFAEELEKQHQNRPTGEN